MPGRNVKQREVMRGRERSNLKKGGERSLTTEVPFEQKPEGGRAGEEGSGQREQQVQ